MSYPIIKDTWTKKQGLKDSPLYYNNLKEWTKKKRRNTNTKVINITF